MFVFKIMYVVDDQEMVATGEACSIQWLLVWRGANQGCRGKCTVWAEMPISAVGGGMDTSGNGHCCMLAT